MVKHTPKCYLAMLILGLFPLFLQAADHRRELAVLADSVQKMIGKKELPNLSTRLLRLASELKDTTRINDAYTSLTAHYYQLGDIDSLKLTTYKYMNWCNKSHQTTERYTVWRECIQRMTEKGMQEEAMAETAKLCKEAELAKDKYGLACGEMCVGYNHRVFGNNVKLCLENYNNALKLFEAGNHLNDAYVVLLNIIQTHLSRSEYADAEGYLAQLTQLEEKMKNDKVEISTSLHLRFFQFKVISLLAGKGKKAAESYMTATDRYYREHPESATPEAWFGYKIMCCRTLGDLKGNITYVDSLMAYQHSLGFCYPYNHFMKAQLQEQLGDYRSACGTYAQYAAVSDSMRTAEMDDKLSKYAAQFDVDKLKMEKLELSAKLNRDRLTLALIAGGLILLLLLFITYLYVRTLTMHRKLDAARKAVQKMAQVKSSFIQHITHEIRTPLNSIVGFSTLLASESQDEEERNDYAQQVESNNIYLLGLMENILMIADMDSQALDMPREEVDIEACCHECMDKLHPLLQPGVQMECLPSSSIETTSAIRSWMMVVLTVLLDNAVKFTDKGHIRISYEEDKAHHKLRFVVEDTGIGIEPEMAEHLFERFFKVNTFTKGAGLGLAIAREVMEQVDGRVFWDSTYHGGCRFVIEWPLYDKT